MNRIYKPLLFLMMITVFFSCRKDEIKYEEDIVIIQTTEDGEVGLQGHITDTSKTSVAGAQVLVGDQTALTDEYGFFLMNNAKVVNGNVTITIEKENFITQYKKVTVVEGMKDAFVRASLISKQNTNHTFESDQTTTIIGNGGHAVTFLANSIVRENGSDYIGTVIFSSYYIDPTRSDLAYIMPGDLSAINLQGEEVQLVSFGMLYGELTTPSGEPLQIKEGSTATIELEIQNEQIDNAPDQIPLWSLDEQSATWIEEGVAVKQGNKYVAKVSHFSFWNYGASHSIIDLVGCAIDQNGIPISNATLSLSISGYGDSRYFMTDQNGCFRGKVPKDADLLLDVKNECAEKVSIALDPFSEHINLGVVAFDISQFGYAIEGKLQDCNLSAVYPGVVELTSSIGENTLVPTDEEGTFSITLMSCNETQVYVKGIDPIELLTGESFTQDLVRSTINSMGSISLCEEEVEDFLTISINGQAQSFSNLIAERLDNVLRISGENSLLTVIIKIDEDNLIEPILSVGVIQKSDFTQVVWWGDDCNEFISFDYTENGNNGPFVAGTLNGVYDDIDFQADYKLTVLTRISGVVWDDLNENGIFDINEPIVTGMKISITNSAIDIDDDFYTAFDGQYLLRGSHIGINTLTIEIPDGYQLTVNNIGSDNTINSNFQSDGTVQIEIADIGKETEFINAGLFLN